MESRRPPVRRYLAIAVAMLVLGLWLAQAQAAVVFTRTDHQAGASPRGAVSADFDGDGIADLAVANSAAGTVSVFRGNAGGGFSEPTVYDVGAAPWGLAAADFNGDTLMDLAVTDYSAGRVYVLYGQEDGTLGAEASYAAGENARAVAAVDVNADGRPDLVLLNSAGVRVILAGAAGGFSTRSDYSLTGEPTGLAAADFNGDGFPDIAVSTSAGSSDAGSVVVLYGQADGRFATRRTLPAGREPVAVAAADVNGDSRQDLVVANRSSRDVMLFHGTGDGRFETAIVYDLGKRPAALAVADIDSNGAADIVAANPDTGDISVLFGRSGGGVLRRIDYAAGSSPRTASAADFTGDGRMDLAVAGNDGIVSLLAARTGGLARPVSINVGAGSYGIAVGDFNNDARGDVAVTNAGDDDISALYGRSSGGLGSRADFRTGARPAGIVAADFNADGETDLAIANADDGTVRILTGRANGTFANAGTFETGPGTWAVAAADFSGDSRLDLVTANRADGTITVLYGDGSGGFDQRADHEAGAGAADVATGDWNGDGIPDVAVANRDAGYVTVFVTETTGQLAGRTELAIDGGSTAIAAGDFNGDGLSDLAVARRPLAGFPGGAAIVIFLRQEGGGFAEGVEHPLAAAPEGIAAADLDGDGRLDIIAASPGDATVTVLRGMDDGLFTDRMQYYLAAAPQKIASGHFNADSTADVVMTAEGNVVLLMFGEMQPLAITTATLPGGAVGAQYSAVILADGGLAPYTWSLSSGDLPEGISLDATTGVLAGTPAAAGEFPLTLAVADSRSPAGTAQRPLLLRINPALEITTETVANGRVGRSYNQQMTAAGGVPPYMWAVLMGNLPNGLSLDLSTGVISGTPGAEGDYGFIIRVLDSQNPPMWTFQQYAMAVYPIDLDGPEVRDLATVPTVAREGLDRAVTLVATADDTESGHNAIQAAEYFIGPDPGPGAGRPMAAADGAFDGVVEALTAEVDASAWQGGDVITIHVRARDVAGFWGDPATVDVEVVDGSAPAAIRDLTAGGSSSFQRLPASVSSHSGASPGAPASALVDADLSTAWMSSGTAMAEDEYFILDAGEVRKVAAVGLMPAWPMALFPRDLRVETSEDGEEWTRVAAAQALRPARAGHLWQFEPAEIRYVRVSGPGVWHTRERRHYWQIAEAAIFDRLDEPVVNLAWTAPADNGDDASSGPASLYDIRYSTTSITPATFDASPRAAGFAEPQAPGSREVAGVTIGQVSGRVYLAIKTGDEVPNWSEMSNVAATTAGVSGFTSLSPDDGAPADAATPRALAFAVDPTAARPILAISTTDGFPTGAVRREDGQVDRTMRFPLKPGTTSFTPSTPQWRALKNIATTDAALHWRLEGLHPEHGMAYGPSRSLLFDCGVITNLAVDGSHLSGENEAVWPEPDRPPTFRWTDETQGMAFFFVDVSADPAVPVRNSPQTILLGGRGIAGTSYTPTPAQWRRIRQIATLGGGTVYWRVRASDADRALTISSGIQPLVVDGGSWTVSQMAPDGSGRPAVEWSNDGRGLERFALQVSVSDAFAPGARSTLNIPARPFAGGSYSLSPAEVARLQRFAAINNVSMLHYRVRGEDTERAFITYSPPVLTPVP